MLTRFHMRFFWSTSQGRRSSLLTLALAITSSSCILQAQSRVDVKPLLEGYEWTLEPEPFVCNGDGMDVALREMASNETVLNYYRLRALTALSLFPNPETATYLEQVISDGASHPSRVQRALDAYARAFADEQPERVMEVARAALGASADAQVQTAAAMTLAALPTPESQALLRQYLNSGLSDLQRQQLRYLMRESRRVNANSKAAENLAPLADYDCP